MRITVCDFPDEAARAPAAWDALAAHLAAAPADILVLPEMPFHDWAIFTERRVDEAAWNATVARHEAMIAELGGLDAGLVLASRPREFDGRRLNSAFAVSRTDGPRDLRAKYYLPDEPDGWEATWFDFGDLDFTPSELGGIRVGVQLCTELLLSERSREIGAAGGQLIAAPRATGAHPRWQLAARMAAIMSGCFVATANRRSLDGATWPGGSWIVSPDGEVLAETSAERPIASADVELAEADRAKLSYPRNLRL